MATFKVDIRRKVEKPVAGSETETFIHFGQPWRMRFKLLAARAGYTRAENEFGRGLFTQALTAAYLDFIRQTDPEAYAVIVAADANGYDEPVWGYDIMNGKLDPKVSAAATKKQSK